jgi:hypothetical protein
VSIALVNSRSDAALVWSAPGLFSYSSGLPILSGSGTPAVGDGINSQLYIQTSTTPQTIWFKQSGTWNRLVGSTLYADLTSAQTVAGIKTFSSPIVGSVTGTAANVTGIVPIVNGGTGSTTANGAFNALAPSQTSQAGKYLTTDGTNTSWGTNPLGTVTSVDVSGGTTGLTTSGGPVTTSGTITLAGTLAVANGGTGATTAGVALTNLGAVGTIASADASIVVTRVGSSVDLSVSTTSPASVLLEQVRNTTGATLTKGTAVYISGATGQIPTVSKALATSDATSAQTLGLITSNLANNSNGFVTIIGLISDLDTSAYTDGQQLYLSPITAGTLTATKPYAPQHLVYMAVVSYAHPTQGKLLVKVQNGYELDELHNVAAQSPTTGQTIVWNSATSLWEKNTVSLTVGVNGILPILNGGTGQTTANGAFNALAPSQTGNTGKYLTTDGSNTSWAANPLGTVTSVAASVPSFLSIAGSPITTSGTLAISLSGTALPTTSGGTGLTSFTANGVVYASSSSALATGSALTFDGGSLGVGSNPTASSRRSIQISDAAEGYFLSNTRTALGVNFTFNGNNFYIQNGYAGYFELDSPSGAYKWFNSASGLTGGVVSFIQAMTLTADGNLALGNTSALSASSGRTDLTINGASSGAIISFGNGAVRKGYIYNDGTTLTIANESTGNIRLLSGGDVRATLDSAGNLGLGVTPSAFYSTYRVLEGASGALYFRTDTVNDSGFMANSYRDTSAVYRFKQNGAATYYSQGAGTHQFFTSTSSGTAGGVITFTQAMTLDASGNFVIGDTTAGARLSVVKAITGGNIGTSFQQELVNNNGAVIGDWTGTVYRWITGNANTNQAYIGAVLTNNNSDTLSDLVFGVKNTNIGNVIVEAMRIKQGNLLIGTNSASGSGATSAKQVIQFDGAIGNGVYIDDTRTAAGYDVGLAFGRGASVIGLLDTSLTSFRIRAVGELVFASNATDGMVLDTSRNLQLGGNNSYGGLRAVISGPAVASSTGGGSYIVASIADTNAMATGVGGGLGFQGNDGVNGLVTFATVNGSKENSTSGNYASYLAFKTRIDGGVLTEQMRISSTGNVAIGQLDTVSARFSVSSTTDKQLSLRYAGVASWYNSVKSSGDYVWDKDGADAMRITSAGDLVVGAQSTGAYFDSKGNFYSPGTYSAFGGKQGGGVGAAVGLFWHTASTGDPTFAYFLTEASPTVRGTITYNRSAGIVSYNATSDYRLKENIVDLPNALAKVAQLKPRQFDWKETGITTTGFVAHELAEVLPHAVTGEKDGLDEKGQPKYQGINTSFLVATLTSAIQEQQAIIESLKARLDAANL